MRVIELRHSLLVSVCAALCLVTTATAQQPQSPATPQGQPDVTFKAEVNYVDVDAIVTDQQGNFIKNLTKDDFELLEDGKPQKVEMFSYVDLPIERSNRSIFASRVIATDVKTNRQALAGRLCVIVLDDLDISFFRTSAVRKAARQFIERNLGPNDVVAVVYTSGRADASQEFTSDQRLLLAAVDKFVGRKLRSSTLDRIDTFYQQQQDPTFQATAVAAADSNAGSSISSGRMNASSESADRTFDSEDLERGQRALGVLDELKNLADIMGDVHGRRKAILLFSEGVDYPMENIFGRDATLVVSAAQDAIIAAARGNVSFFSIDPRGLVGMQAEAIEMSKEGATSDPTSSMNLSGLAAEMRLSQDSLRSLAEETGGLSSVNDNDPATFFDRIVRANSTYYVLGYYPPTHPRDGQFHKIDVRVKRPGLKVSARKGYAGPRGKTLEDQDKEDRERMARDARKGGADTTSADLRVLLNSPMQQGGVTMTVQAVPFKNAAKEASVAVAIEIDSSRFHFEPRNNGAVFADQLELSYFSVNEQGKPQQGTRTEMNLSLRPDSYERAQQVGLRLNPRILLAPGRYQLRIGVRENGGGALGTVFYDVQVPDFTKESLSMSGMLMTAGTSQLVPTLVSDKLVGTELLPGPATTRRVFVQSDTLAVYAEIYDNIPARQTHTIEIATHLLGEDGREIFRSRETHNGAALQGVGNPVTLSFAKQIPLKDVPPGRYLLQVQAQALGSPKGLKPVVQETVLTVVADVSR